MIMIKCQFVATETCNGIDDDCDGTVDAYLQMIMLV